MSIRSAAFIPAALIVLLCAMGPAPAQAQTSPVPVLSLADRLHAAAMDSYRQGRFAEAFGRFTALADAGHPPAAAMALWMYQDGPTRFGRDWDSSPDQLAAWAQLVGQPAPLMVARVYPQRPTPVSQRTR